MLQFSNFVNTGSIVVEHVLNSSLFIEMNEMKMKLAARVANSFFRILLALSRFTLSNTFSDSFLYYIVLRQYLLYFRQSACFKYDDLRSPTIGKTC